MNLTRHAQERCKQRAISQHQIQIVLDYGRPIRTDCLVLDDRSLEGTPFQNQGHRLRGLCVALTPDGGVQTVMWLERIRRRPGKLRGSRLKGASRFPREFDYPDHYLNCA